MSKRLGVLGGMGPAASAEFMVRLIAQTPAKRDQDHIPAILWSDTTVPDRSTSMRNGDDKPLPYLLAGIQGLISTGCNIIVIPCNTAHFWFNEMEKQASWHAKIAHIVDSVADALRDIKVTNAKIGVMGTQATIELGMYQYRLNKLGWDCIAPTKEEMDTLVQPAIDLIKANQIAEAYPMLMTVIHSLIDKGAKAVVLGCTEIPLSIKEDTVQDTPIINSIDSLVKSVIKEFKKGKLT
jgi:aspartate racemase